MAISLDEAPTSRSTTPDSRSRLPSISMPMSGEALGTSRPVSSVTAMGKRTRVSLETGREVYSMRISRSWRVVSKRMMGGWMMGTRLM